MDIVVIVNVPLCVVGEPSYIYCMLFDTVSVREALRSILRFLTGSSVVLICKSFILLVAAGVATLSLARSHPLSIALSIYESSIAPNAKSRPGERVPSPLVCPNASPMVGMNPGRDMEYWSLYETLTLRTIIITLAMHCAVLYHPLFSSGSLGVTVSFIFIDESVLLNSLILLSSTFFHFTSIVFPSADFAFTIMRFVFFPWDITMAVSAAMVISFSKLFLFLGSSFCFLPFPLSFSPSLSFFSFGIFLFVFVFFLTGVTALLLNLSFVFLRNGICPYSFSRFSVPLIFIARLVLMVLPSDVPSSRLVPLTQE